MPPETAAAPILQLRGEYADWSNFGLREVRVFGRTWKTSEHAFQAAKFFGTDEEHVETIAAAPTPGKAKRLGNDRAHPKRPDWDSIAPNVMTLIVLRKFEQHVDLASQLVRSAPATIVEGNDHGDDRWGAVWVDAELASHLPLPVWARRDKWLVGRNQLGKVLMLVRRELS